MSDRFFVPQECIAAGEILVPEAESRHITQVLRKKTGDLLCFCTGDGLDYYAEILSADRSGVRLRLIRTEKNDRLPTVRITAFLGALKGDKLELAVQKLSELGVTEVVPFFSRYTVVKEVRKERLCRIAVESAKQCGRADFLQIGDSLPFDGMLKRLSESERILFAYENERTHSLKKALCGAPPKSAALIVGCEGGFCPEEAAAIAQAGGETVGLGSRILRAETAAIAFTAIVMHAWEDM